MSPSASLPLLRTLLWADAASCLATAALHLLATRPLSDLLALPAPLLRGSGLLLCGYVVWAVVLATRPAMARRPLAAFVAANFAWSVAALVLLAGGPVTPSGVGKAYLLVQGVAVGVLAQLQWLAGRRLAPDARA